MPLRPPGRKSGGDASPPLDTPLLLMRSFTCGSVIGLLITASAMQHSSTDANNGSCIHTGDEYDCSHAHAFLHDNATPRVLRIY
jgi:hypothetical protein